MAILSGELAQQDTSKRSNEASSNKLRPFVYAVTASIALSLISRLAFTRGARKEMFIRDDGTCQHCGRTWDDGWHMQGAHFTWLDSKRGPTDEDISRGRLLCTECHIVEEFQAGNEWGAIQLWQNQTIRNYNWLRSHPSERDPKESLNYYASLAGVQLSVYQYG